MANLVVKSAETLRETVTILGLNREGIKGEFLKILNNEFFKKAYVSLDMNLSLEVPEASHLGNIVGAGLVSNFLSEIVKDVIEERTGKRPDIQGYISDFVLKIRQ
jgi:hypothetical protein